MLYGKEATEESDDDRQKANEKQVDGRDREKTKRIIIKKMLVRFQRPFFLRSFACPLTLLSEHGKRTASPVTRTMMFCFDRLFDSNSLTSDHKKNLPAQRRKQ